MKATIFIKSVSAVQLPLFLFAPCALPFEVCNFLSYNSANSFLCFRHSQVGQILESTSS